MSTPLLNPLCTLDELKLTLKWDLTDTAKDDELRKAINAASRWVETHTGKEFRFFDYRTAALEVDEHDGIALQNIIFLPHRRIVSLTAVSLAGASLIAGQDYAAKFDEGKVILLSGDWNLHRPDRIAELVGTFGYRQPLLYPVTPAGDTGAVLSNWSLRDVGAAAVYWGVTELAAGAVRVELWRDAAHATRIAFGSGTPPDDIVLDEDNSSGVFGTVHAANVATDTDAGNTLTPGDPTIDTAEVPEGLPGNVTQAARVVAAVFSGHHTKEISGLDGIKQTVKAQEIPKDVFLMLGRRAPIQV